MTELQSILDHLESAGLMQPVPGQPDLEYLFRHVLVQEAAYGSLLRADQRRLHAAAGEALEVLYPDQRAALAPVLANHFLEAGNTLRALAYLTLAGKAALDNYANREASRFYEAALPLAADDRERADLLAGLAEALSRLGHHRAAANHLLDAAGLYAEAGDSDGLARMYVAAARTIWETGDMPGSLALALEGLDRLVAAPPTPGLAALLHEAARAYGTSAQPDHVEPLARRALAMAQQTGAVGAEAEAWITLGTFTPAPVADRRAWLEKAIALAEAADLPATAARAHNNLAALLDNFCGQVRLSQGHYRRAAAHAEKRGSVVQQIMFLSRVGMSLLWTGDLVEVATTLRKVRQLLGQVEETGSSIRAYSFTEALLLRYEGRLAEAAGRLRALYDRAQAQGDRMLAASVSVYLGELLLELDDLAEAERLLEEGALIADQGIGLGPVWPRCLLVAVRGRMGDLEGAAAALDSARRAATTAPDYYAPIYLAFAEARLATRRGDPDAPARWPAVLARLEAVDWHWYTAQARREWAAALLATGDPADRADALALLDQARAYFQIAPAPAYAKQVAAERAALAAEL